MGNKWTHEYVGCSTRHLFIGICLSCFMIYMMCTSMGVLIDMVSMVVILTDTHSFILFCNVTEALIGCNPDNTLIAQSRNTVNLYWTQSSPSSNTSSLDMALHSTQPSSNNY